MAFLYASPSGNDTTGDGSIGTPYKTIQKCHDVANGGDTIVVRGIHLEEEVDLSRTFTEEAPLTIIPYDDDLPDVWVDGNWTTPATGAGLKTGPDGTAHWAPLVKFSGDWIDWRVNVRKSLGRNIGIENASNITVQAPVGQNFVTLEYARSANFNCIDSDVITTRKVLVQYGACFYRSIRNPNEAEGGTNWPVCFNHIGTTNVLSEDCVTYQNWGEGFALGRGSDGGQVYRLKAIDNMSANGYINRSQNGSWIQCFFGATGNGIGFQRSPGLALRNENNPNVTPPLNNILVAHCLFWGNHNNFVIGANQEEGDTIENIFFWFNTSVNARLGSNGSTFSNIRLAAGDRTGIDIYGNIFWQDSGPYAKVGNLAGHTFAKNFWGGQGSLPPSGVISGSDLSGVAMASPNASWSVIQDSNGGYTGITLDPENYRVTAANPVLSKTGIGLEDYARGDRPSPAGTAFWSIGALEYGQTSGGGGGDPDPPPPPTGEADITIARAACNTSAGNQTISLTGLSEAPNLFFFFVDNTTAEDTASTGVAMSYGVAATSSGEWAVGNTVEDAESPSNASRFSATDACVLLPNQLGNSIHGKAAYVSATSTGVTINWTTAPPSGFLLTVIALVVPNAYVGSPLQNASKNGYVTVTPGFEPDIIGGVANGRPWPNETGNQSLHFGRGWASWDGTTLKQLCMMHTAVDNISANEALGHIDNTRLAGFMNTSGTVVWTVEVSDITSTDFRLYTRGTPSPQSNIGIVAFELGTLGSYIGLHTSPASAVTSPSTTNEAWSGFGFQPKFALVFNSLLSVLNSTVSTGDAGAFGVSAFTASIEKSLGWSFEDSPSGTSNSQSFSGSSALNLPLDDGTTGLEASFSSFDVGGLTLTFTEAPATARYQLVLAIEQTTTVAADFDGTPTSGNSPLEVDFDASASSAVGTTIATYRWDWGDGSDPEETASATISHIFTTTSETGETFTIGLTVIGANAEESYFARPNYITATYVPPPPPSVPPDVNYHVFAGGGSHMKPNGIPAAGGTLG